MTTLELVLLVGVGFFSGFVNTLAGGGSFLTLPVLMLMGMPADVANATNRVCVLTQSAGAAASFSHEGVLDWSTSTRVVLLTAIGALVGAFLSTVISVEALRTLIIILILLMSLTIIIRPKKKDEGDSALDFRWRLWPSLALFISGVYGGFIQAGVGILLLAVLNGSLGLRLVAANAVKVACVAVLSAGALAIFALNGLVMWVPGLVLSIGTVAGAQLAVKTAMKGGESFVRYLVFTMTLVSCAAVIWQTMDG